MWLGTLHAGAALAQLVPTFGHCDNSVYSTAYRLMSYLDVGLIP